MYWALSHVGTQYGTTSHAYAEAVMTKFQQRLESVFREVRDPGLPPRETAYRRVPAYPSKSAAKHGTKQLMLINWHEGNIPSLAIAAEALHREHGLAVLTVQACYVAEELFGAACGGGDPRGREKRMSRSAWSPARTML